MFISDTKHIPNTSKVVTVSPEGLKSKLLIWFTSIQDSNRTQNKRNKRSLISCRAVLCIPFRFF